MGTKRVEAKKTSSGRAEARDRAVDAHQGTEMGTRRCQGRYAPMAAHQGTQTTNGS